MNYRRYIQGDRKGRDANRIEREAMTDPFLADALEGYEQAESLETKRIGDIRKEIKLKTRRRHFRIRNWTVAASLLICTGLGAYFLLNTNKFPAADRIAQSAPETVADEVEMIRQDSAVDETLAVSRPVPSAPAEAESLVIEDIAIADNKEDNILAEEAEETAQEAVQEQAQTAKEIPAKPQAAVVAAAPPMATQAEERIADNQDEDKQALDEVVVIAYGTQKRSRETTAPPQPVIGNRAYKKYLKEHLVRPTDDECKDIKGKVTVLFHIGNDGKPYNFTIKKALCPSADKEAIRLIEEGPLWTTGNKEVSITIKF